MRPLPTPGRREEGLVLQAQGRWPRGTRAAVSEMQTCLQPGAGSQVGRASTCQDALNTETSSHVNLPTWLSLSHSGHPEASLLGPSEPRFFNPAFLP